MSTSQRADVHTNEREQYRVYASEHSEAPFRPLLQYFYRRWDEFRARHFKEYDLKDPHIAIGRTASRSLSHCDATTEYGARTCIRFNERLFRPVNPDWVIEPWPSVGLRALVDDLLLRGMVRQVVLEAHGAAEEGYRGYGPLFARECNRLRFALALDNTVEVVSRHRSRNEEGLVCTGWPCNARNDEYYGNAITERGLALARAQTTRRANVVPPSLGMAEFWRWLLSAKKHERLRRSLNTYMDFLQHLRERRFPLLRRVEAGEVDVDKKTTLEVEHIVVDSSWLIWNNGCVRKMAEGIFEHRSFAELPILADALEDAGCVEDKILRHARARIEHTRSCWVLRILLAACGEDSRW